MKKNRFINITLLTMLTFLSCLNFSSSFAKFTSKYIGLGWLTDFTSFKLLDKVHIITESGSSSGKLYGAEGSFKAPTAENLAEMTEDEYNNIVETIKSLDPSVQLPSYENRNNDSNSNGILDFYDVINSSSLNDTSKSPSEYGGHYYFPQDKFNDFVEEGDKFVNNPYAIRNISDIAFNVLNNTDKPLLLCFDVYYYQAKANNAANSISFALYNTTLRGDHLDYNNSKVLKGEFPIKYDTGLITKTAVVAFYKQKIPNVLGHRTGGGCEVVDKSSSSLFNNGTEYYPCAGYINPYNIKVDPILSLDKINTVFSGIKQFNSNEPDSSAIDINYNLNDFVIPSTGEVYSYNLSLFYGNTFGKNNNDGYAFLAGIEIYTIEITSEVQARLDADKSLG